MDIILFGLIFLLLIIPTFITMRKQQKRQREVVGFQNQLAPGQRVITAGGIHATVAAVRDGEVDVEISRGVVVTMDKMGILRPESDGQSAVGSEANKAAERAGVRPVSQEESTLPAGDRGAEAPQASEANQEFREGQENNGEASGRVDGSTGSGDARPVNGE